MNAVVIEHVPLADLPLAWRDKLPKAKFARKSHVTVRIEQEQLLPTPVDKEEAALKALMANPMVGMWADRGDMADVQAYVRKLREPRYGRDGTRRKNGIQIFNPSPAQRMMLIDSDVLVWMTRGHAGAVHRLAQQLPWQLSAVTYIELAQGCRSKIELAQILPVTASITERAMALVDSHALSHGLQLGDALIAATALEHGLTLLTGNKKHFAKLPGLSLEVFKP